MRTRAYRERGLFSVVIGVQVLLQFQHAELQLVQEPTGKELETGTVGFKDRREHQQQGLATQTQKT